MEVACTKQEGDSASDAMPIHQIQFPFYHSTPHCHQIISITCHEDISGHLCHGILLTPYHTKGGISPSQWVCIYMDRRNIFALTTLTPSVVNGRMLSERLHEIACQTSIFLIRPVSKSQSTGKVIVLCIDVATLHPPTLNNCRIAPALNMQRGLACWVMAGCSPTSYCQRCRYCLFTISQLKDEIRHFGSSSKSVIL